MGRATADKRKVDQRLQVFKVTLLVIKQNVVGLKSSSVPLLVFAARRVKYSVRCLMVGLLQSSFESVRGSDLHRDSGLAYVLNKVVFTTARDGGMYDKMIPVPGPFEELLAEKLI